MSYVSTVTEENERENWPHTHFSVESIIIKSELKFKMIPQQFGVSFHNRPSFHTSVYHWLIPTSKYIQTRQSPRHSAFKCALMLKRSQPGG